MKRSFDTLEVEFEFDITTHKKAPYKLGVVQLPSTRTCFKHAATKAFAVLKSCMYMNIPVSYSAKRTICP